MQEEMRERDSPFQVPPHVLGHEEHFSIAPERTRSKRLHIQVPETPYKTCQVVLSISSRGNWIEKEFIVSLFNERKRARTHSLTSKRWSMCFSNPDVPCLKELSSHFFLE